MLHLQMMIVIFSVAGFVVGLYHVAGKLVIPRLRAASSPWTQTDWSGGDDAAVATGTVTTWKSLDSIEATASTGQISLDYGEEEFINNGFNENSDIDSWLGADPSSINGLHFHVKADTEVYTDAGLTEASDGETVQQWNDQSGEGNNASQITTVNQPTYETDEINGRSVIQFTPDVDSANNGEFLTATLDSLASLQEMTILSVASFDYSTQPSSNYDYLYGLGNPSETSKVISLSRYPSTNFYYNYYNKGVYNGPAISSGFKIFSQKIENTGNRHFAWYDRSSQEVDAIPGLYTFNNPRITIAKWHPAGTWNLNGRIAEILVYNNALSDSDRVKVENYLANKYALAGVSLSIDTETKYSGLGSLKIVSGSYTSEITQSVNVDDADEYNFEAYAYTDGSEVTGNDVELYYNGSTVTTTYTNQGNGWYKLTGSVVGSNEFKSYGAQIKANKTVYLDDFSLYKYASSGTLTSNPFDAGFASDWGEITYTTSGSGTVTVKARTDSDGDFSNAADWGSCTALTSGDDLSETDTTCITDTHQYLQYQVTLEPDGAQSPVFEEVVVNFSASDTIPPSSNATNVSLTSLSAGDWTNTEPTITWTAGQDDSAGNGLAGYCLSLNEVTKDTASDLLDPETDAGVLTGIDDGIANNSTCPYIVSSTSIDLSSIDGLNLSAGQQYYFSIKAVDLASNVFTGSSSDYQDLTNFKYDTTPPSNPSYISLPSDFIATKSATIIWPHTGSDAPSDNDSGVAGLQYRIGSDGTWYGDDHTGTEDLTDLLANDGSYELVEDPDFASLNEGSNIIYFRTLDTAGNTSSTNMQSALKINTSAPSAPLNLTVTPTDSTTNSYSFSWDAPTTYIGQEDNLTYCYTINAVPTDVSCNFTEAGATSLEADAFATQPGENIFYLVARDEASNINYDVYSQVDFTYSGTAPGIVENLDVADVSVKATSSWKLALSWEEPTNTGAGVSTYQIYSSTDDETYTQRGTAADISYVDTNLTQTTHYYKVRACDSANSCGAFSQAVSLYPDGKFTEAASLTSGPTVSSITTKKATVGWSTARNSDSKIQFGTSSGSYFDEEVSNSTQVTSHELKLTNLSAGTTYYYKVKWTDEDGNTGLSEEKTFSTDPAPTVTDPNASVIGLDYAMIDYTVAGAEKVKIYYGDSTSFGGSLEITTSTSETTYSTKLSGLADGTKYYYKINTFDTEDEEYEGSILTFETLPRPRISNVRLQQVRGASTSTVLITWTSNTPITSVVTYYPSANSGQALDDIDVKLTESHRALISGLLPSSAYTLVVKGRDRAGNEATSNPQTFTTATDTRPPTIANLKVEPVIEGVGEEAVARLVVSWDTDESSTGQVTYGEGSTGELTSSTQISDSLTFNHVVVVPNLSPSKVYHLKALSNDEAGNEAESVDTVVITPKATDSALNLVVKNLSHAFGFLKGIEQ